MPVYGYQRAVVDEKYGLLELREVTFSFSPADLRRLARFLEHFAGEIESRVSGEIEPRSWRTAHVHLTNFDREWRRDHPEVDVIIANPDPEPPAWQEEVPRRTGPGSLGST